MKHFTQTTNLFLLALLAFFPTFIHAQMEVPSTWKLTGAAAANLEGNGIDSTKMHFLGGGVFQLTYESGGIPQTETSTWADIDATNFIYSYEPTGATFGNFCPYDTSHVEYSISGNVLTMVNLTGTCTIANTVLTGSQWNKVIQSASVDEFENGIHEIFPNPTTGQAQVSLGSKANLFEIRLLSVLGQELPVTYSNAGENTILLDLSHLNKGMYYLSVGSASKKSIIIQ